MISEALKLSADPHSPFSMSGPPPPQRRGEARNLRLRSSSRARTPAPSHSCAGGSEQEAVCDVRRSRAAWMDRAQGNTAGTSKGKGCAGGSGQQKGYGAETGSKGYRRGKGKRAQEPLVGTGHQKFRVACINLGGWRKRIKYVYEWNMWNMPADLILCCEVDVVTYEQMTQEVQKWEPPDSPAAVQEPPQGYAEKDYVHRWVASPLHKGCAIFGLAHRVQKLTMFDPYEKHLQSGWSRVLPVQVKWHQPVFDRMEAFVAVFHLHNNHAKKDGEPRKGLYDCLAECCAGGCRILAGDMNMAFWGLIPELSDRGVEVRLIAHHAEWNIALERWQWDTCGIWVCGPMPKPGQCLTMTMHSRCGMIHPFALDGKTNNRGYTGSCFNKTHQVPFTEDVVDEAVMRELSKYLRDRMRIYTSGAALAAHMPDLIPEDPVHALESRFQEDFKGCPEVDREDIAQCWWRLPPRGNRFWRTEGMSPAPECCEVMANSILWDPCGVQWGRNGHWPLLITYGTKRYRSEGMQQRRAATAELKAEQKRSKGGEEEGVEHAALAAVAPREAPDTGGASGSADVPPYLLPNVQAARMWSQASWVGHTQ